jgi:hypothetical protein
MKVKIIKIITSITIFLMLSALVFFKYCKTNIETLKNIDNLVAGDYVVSAFNFQDSINIDSLFEYLDKRYEDSAKKEFDNIKKNNEKYKDDYLYNKHVEFMKKNNNQKDIKITNDHNYLIYKYKKIISKSEIKNSINLKLDYDYIYLYSKHNNLVDDNFTAMYCLVWVEKTIIKGECKYGLLYLNNI